MFRKAIAILTVFSLSTTVLIAGGCKSKTVGNNDQGKQQNVVFWDINSGPERTPYYQELIKRFQAGHKNITVQYVGLPNSSAEQKVNVAIAGNDVPDVLAIQTNWLSKLYAKDSLTPLDSYFNSWSEKDQTPKSYIDNLKATVSNNKLYCLPASTTFDPVYWYRTDWFKDAGLDAPATWDDFFNDIKTLTNKSKGRYGFSIRGGTGGPVQLQEYLYSYSGISEPFTKDGKSTINDPKNLEALQKLVAIYKNYTPESDISNGMKEMVAAFDSGTVAIIQHNLGSYTQHKQALGDDKFAMFVAPKAANGKRVVAGVTPFLCYSIMKLSKNQDASWTFLSYLCSKDAQNYFNQNIGQVPTNITLGNEKWVTDSQHISLAIKTEKDSSCVSFPTPLYLPDYQSIQDSIVLPGFQAVLAGKESPKDLLDQWANAMTKDEAEYQSSTSKAK